MDETRTAETLDYSGDSAVLLQYRSGEPALWVRDEHQAGRVDDPASPARYTLNDTNTSVPLGRGEDVDEEMRAWKRAVAWDEDED